MTSMASHKQPKGCYNCMKRRIICDRTEPHCYKCSKKGLACPGMGVRYRFNDGIAARGKFKGRDPFSPSNSANNDLGEPSTASSGQLPVVPPARIKWVGAPKGPGQSTRRALRTQKEPVADNAVSSQPSSTSLAAAPETQDPNVEEVEDEGVHLPSRQLTQSIIPALEFLDPRTRFLFSHFNTYVSPVMLLFDDERNGYRHLILPFACVDEVVQRAVSVAAAFHLSARMPELRSPAEIGRAAIISKLRDAVDQQDCAQVLNESTWATLLLLIVADLVTGSDDLVILYRMLVSFMEAHKDTSDNSPLTEFLRSQSKLIEYFALPIMDENMSATKLGLIGSPVVGFEQQAPGSGDQAAISLYDKAYKQARDIYLLRALSSTSPDALDETTVISIIENFKQLLADVDPTKEGAHTLVWPYFVAAAESRLPVHREFFYGRLEYIWNATGYDNVRVALNVLKQLWDKQGTERWTAMLPRINSTIIM